jgi:aminomethyltransferase
LYGHDIDDKTTPGEAVLGWTIGKKKRAGSVPFLGSEAILKQLNEKSMTRKRVGLAIEGAPAREGAKIYALPKGATASATEVGACKQVGIVTSGTFSPCLKAPIAMGYVASELSNIPTDASAPATIAVEVRGKLIPAKVTKMPFVPNRYYKPAGSK